LGGGGISLFFVKLKIESRYVRIRQQCLEINIFHAILKKKLY